MRSWRGSRRVATPTSTTHLTPLGTAMYLAYEVVPMPAASLAASPAASSGSPAPTSQYDCVVIEVDPVTGARVWEWHPAHIDSTRPRSPTRRTRRPRGSCHANSVHLDDDGNVLVSAGNTSCVYKVDHATGEVLWRLGGKYGDLELLDGLTIALQHDARRQPDGTITIFDNGHPPAAARGLVVEVDETAGTARLLRVLSDPKASRPRARAACRRFPTATC